MQVEDYDVGDGGETVALSIQENSCSYMDDFFKQVMYMVYLCTCYRDIFSCLAYWKNVTVLHDVIFVVKSFMYSGLVPCNYGCPA